MTKSDTRRVSISISHLFELPLTDLLVLHQCALTKDLSLFEAGDATEVGEKGLTLRFCPIKSMLQKLTDVNMNLYFAVVVKRCEAP